MDCWVKDPKIKQWFLEHHNITDPYHMFAYFEERLGSIVQPSEATANGRVPPAMGRQDPSLPPYVNRTMVVWQDVWNDNWQRLAHPETVVEVWLDQDTLRRVIGTGYRTIWAYPWYLDQQVRSHHPLTHPFTSDAVHADLHVACLFRGRHPAWRPRRSSTSGSTRGWPCMMYVCLSSTRFMHCSPRD